MHMLLTLLIHFFMRHVLIHVRSPPFTYFIHQCKRTFLDDTHSSFQYSGSKRHIQVYTSLYRKVVKRVEKIEQLFQLLTYMFLGALQGFTEPLPISSSGHLVIFRELLHVEATGLSFEIIVHFGSLLAIVAIYRKDIIAIVQKSYQYVRTRKRHHMKTFHYLLYL